MGADPLVPPGLICAEAGSFALVNIRRKRDLTHQILRDGRLGRKSMWNYLTV